MYPFLFYFKLPTRCFLLSSKQWGKGDLLKVKVFFWPRKLDIFSSMNPNSLAFFYKINSPNSIHKSDSIFISSFIRSLYAVRYMFFTVTRDPFHFFRFALWLTRVFISFFMLVFSWTVNLLWKQSFDRKFGLCVILKITGIEVKMLSSIPWLESMVYELKKNSDG